MDQIKQIMDELYDGVYRNWIGNSPLEMAQAWIRIFMHMNEQDAQRIQDIKNEGKTKIIIVGERPSRKPKVIEASMDVRLQSSLM